MKIPVRRWEGESRKWLDELDGVIKVPTKMNQTSGMDQEDLKYATICVIIEGWVQYEGISQGELVLTQF